MPKTTIIGSGLIGRCWAMLFARAGYEVVLFDIAEKQIEEGLKSVKEQLKGLHETGLLKEGQDPDELFALVTGTTVLKDALEGSTYVQECVSENIDLKTKVFKQLDDVAAPECILASSTSCLAPSGFTSGLKHEANCIVAHPVNPPHYIPLVEIIPSPKTSPETVAKTRAIMEELGQAPVTVKKEVNGFIVNRLQYALLMEAWRLVEDGVASPQDVDTAVSKGLGLRWSFMGPFETIDLNANGVENYCDLYGENITAVCKTQSDARDMKKTKTAEEIEAEIRKAYPLDKLAERRAWRDNRLARLAVHKKMMDEQDAGSQ